MKTVNLIATTTAATTPNVSASYLLGDVTNYCVSVDFTGSDVAGTLTLESAPASTGPWTTVLNSSQAITSSGDHMWNVNGASYPWVRVRWVYTSGTGNITVTLVAKNISAVLS